MVNSGNQLKQQHALLTEVSEPQLCFLELFGEASVSEAKLTTAPQEILQTLDLFLFFFVFPSQIWDCHLYVLNVDAQFLLTYYSNPYYFL